VNSPFSPFPFQFSEAKKKNYKKLLKIIKKLPTMAITFIHKSIHVFIHTFIRFGCNSQLLFSYIHALSHPNLEISSVFLVEILYDKKDCFLLLLFYLFIYLFLNKWSFIPMKRRNKGKKIAFRASERRESF